MIPAISFGAFFFFAFFLFALLMSDVIFQSSLLSNQFNQHVQKYKKQVKAFVHCGFNFDLQLNILTGHLTAPRFPLIPLSAIIPEICRNFAAVKKK